MTAFVRCLSCGGRLTSAAESLSDAQGRYVGWRCAQLFGPFEPASARSGNLCV
jgi:hypothetical protein